MTPGIDWGPIEAVGAGIAAAAAVVGPALSSLYVRGKLDAHAKNAAARLEELGRKIDSLETARLQDGRDKGEQHVLNANAIAAASDARAALTLSTKVEERQSAHERGCDKRQEVIAARFDKTDEKMDHLSAEIRNLALGIANNVQHIPATKRQEHR